MNFNRSVHAHEFESENYFIVLEWGCVGVVVVSIE